MRTVLMMMAAALFTTQVYAADLGKMNDFIPCKNIASACEKAGYTRNSNKKFWFECMKPVLMGKTVSGVTISAADVKACREKKIEKAKTELKELQNVR